MLILRQNLNYGWGQMGEKSPIVILASDWSKLNLEDFLFVDSTGLSHQLIVSIPWLPPLQT